ncbi:MAG: hypothetical protein C0504_11620 [Candidatus Solibacter sp.]|nr:hypothetical protein [Candidatus Solibacter sp.]
MMRNLIVAAAAVGAIAWAQESDPGRPILKRGGPATQREKPSEAPPPAAPRGEPVYKEIAVDEEGRGDKPLAVASAENDAEVLIERARAAAYEFNDKLPDFICDQLVVRYESKTRKPEWKQKDRVQVELTYAGGKEDYRNIRVNGKRLKKGSPEDSGSWSTGEFGTTLADIMASNTDAQFRLRKDDSTAAGLKAKVFNFSVAQANSHWTIRYGRSVRPAYNGALWIDPESARVLRIEMDSRRLPVDYDIDKVEMSVDYGWVVISGQRYLLPVKSEVLACQTHSFSCLRNTIEYRNYRKFAVESQLLQVESEITFEDEEKEKSKTTPPSITPEQPKTAPAKKK